MDSANVLQTLAEIAIALAGFGGLMVVLRRDPSGPLTAGENVDLLLVVGGSLVVLLFALLPLPMFFLGLSSVSVWRLTSVLLAAALVALQVTIQRSRASGRTAPLQPLFPRLTRAAGWAPLGLAGLLVPGSLGVIGAAVVGVYLQVLLLLLVASAFPMVGIATRLALDVARTERQD